MCGIIGFSGDNGAEKILTDGLRALSYRGYDSAGVALSKGGTLRTVKTAGRVDRLIEKLKTAAIPDSGCGIGHTRWATHGKPTDINAHPHGTENLALVHNGIIENYSELKDFLSGMGYSFVSDTDTEAAAYLIDHYYRMSRDGAMAMIRSAEMIRGSFAFAVVFREKDDRIYAMRRGSPLIAAVGSGGSYVASDITAIASLAEKYTRPDDGVLCIAEKEELRFLDADMNVLEPEMKDIGMSGTDAALGNYEHYMMKEICEEPEVIRKTVESCTENGLPSFNSELLSPERLKNIGRIRMIGCGTAMHAGLIGKRIVEKLAGVPVEVEIASEFRYEHPIIGSDELAVVISQSGETADTLAALRYAKSIGVPVLAVVNSPGSTIAVEADGVIYTHAGPEIAVASTKAYMVQCAVMFVFAVQMALVRGCVDLAFARKMLDDLAIHVPEAVASAAALQDSIMEITKKIAGAESLFYIGRCSDYAMCCEGSLKLKEISYIHSEAFAAGELKHGTISLVTEKTPVIALLTVPEVFEKTVSGMREAAARGAHVYAICTQRALKAMDIPCDGMIVLPDVEEGMAVFPASTVMQLLAYSAALIRGNDVDKPRNLAKSVTVE